MKSTCKPSQGNGLERYHTYLEELRESGKTNMMGAVPYLLAEFPELTYDTAKNILLGWINSFEKEGE